MKILWQLLAFHDPKLWQHLDEVGKGLSRVEFDGIMMLMLDRNHFG